MQHRLEEPLVEGVGEIAWETSPIQATLILHEENGIETMLWDGVANGDLDYRP